MGTTTSNLGLYKPAVGETGWGTLRNANEDVVDAALGTQHTAAGVHRFVTVTDATGYVKLPSLTTAQRNALTAANGMMVYNSTTNTIQSYEGGAWSDIALGNSQFTDAAFRIYDDAAPTSLIAFSANGITPGNTRTITMPDANVDLGNTGKVGVDSAAAPDYIGATSGVGVVRTGASITKTDGGDFVTLAVSEANVNHDALQNFVANEHVDHSGVTLTAGAGLTGGGDITVNRSFAVNIPGQAAATVASGDLVMIADIDDSNNLKKVTAQSIADLAGSDITVQDEGTPLTTAATLFNFVGAGVTVTEPVADQVLVTIPGAASITVQDEGTPLTTAVTLFNFVGAGVTVTEPVADQVTVTIPGGSGTTAYRDDFVNADLTAGVLTVTHSLGQKYVQVSVYDNTDKKVMPDDITLTNTTTLTIDFTSFGTLTGTWNVIVIG